MVLPHGDIDFVKPVGVQLTEAAVGVGAVFETIDGPKISSFKKRTESRDKKKPPKPALGIGAGLGGVSSALADGAYLMSVIFCVSTLSAVLS